jgi:uridine kinase
VGLPLYDFATHTRRARTRLFRPKPVVLVEGLWLLRDRALRELFDCSIYLDCPIKLRLERRLARDLQKRGRNRQSVLRQFIEQVTPMHNRFVAPQSGWAELVLKSPVTSSQIMGLVKRLKRLSLGISHAGTGEARAVGELDFQATG